MTNILIIFKNFNVQILPETWNFLEKFEQKYYNLESSKSTENKKLPKLLKMFKDERESN